MIRLDCDHCWESWNPEADRWTRRIYYLCGHPDMALTPMGRVLGFKECLTPPEQAEGKLEFGEMRGDVNTCEKCPVYKAGFGPKKIKENPFAQNL